MPGTGTPQSHLCPGSAHGRASCPQQGPASSHHHGHGQEVKVHRTLVHQGCRPTAAQHPARFHRTGWLVCSHTAVFTLDAVRSGLSLEGACAVVLSSRVPEGEGTTAQAAYAVPGKGIGMGSSLSSGSPNCRSRSVRHHSPNGPTPPSGGQTRDASVLPRSGPAPWGGGKALKS